MHVLLADDHELVRDTIRAFLENESGVRVAVASDLAGVERLMRKEGPYDVALLDYSMPGMNGLEGLSKAKEWNFGNPVAIISGTATRAIAEAALTAGAAGFLPKTMATK